ncbi:MAG: class I SAM-dependent RNA methyltransferase [Actinobacteria bacterium]|nr:MAG: class I SAM-dependent RNA methyltransferase [Actinomycetota bacterium]
MNTEHAPNQQITLERLVAGGDALGRLADGRVVFVPGALPGEVVEIAITQSKKDFARAVVSRIITPSLHRVAPPCEHVARGCGGCSWQHLDPTQHMTAKIEIVREALRRNGKIENLEVISGGFVPPSGSRTTLRMAVTPDGRLGFRRGGSHDVIDTPTCLVAHALLNDFIGDVRVTGASEVTLRCGVSTGEIGIWLHDEEGEDVPGATVTGLPSHVVIGRKAVLHEVVQGVALQVSMASFFQASLAAAELLVSTVNDAAGDAALSGEYGPIIDAYGGVGLFTATLVDTDTPVIVVESNPSACSDARSNLHDHNVTIEQIAVEQWRVQNAGLVIADPARNGLGAMGVNALVATEAKRLVLVSCDAVAGARDIRLLIDAGYECESVRVLDLFPNTPHVEVVSSFSRN